MCRKRTFTKLKRSSLMTLFNQIFVSRCLIRLCYTTSYILHSQSPTATDTQNLCTLYCRFQKVLESLDTLSYKDCTSSLSPCHEMEEYCSKVVFTMTTDFLNGTKGKYFSSFFSSFLCSPLSFRLFFFLFLFFLCY